MTTHLVADGDIVLAGLLGAELAPLLHLLEAFLGAFFGLLRDVRVRDGGLCDGPGSVPPKCIKSGRNID